MERREQKIENLLKLMAGELKPEDLKPKRLCMAIGYRAEPIYTINEKEVAEEEYKKWSKSNLVDQSIGVFEVTYGDHNSKEAASYG